MELTNEQLKAVGLNEASREEVVNVALVAFWEVIAKNFPTVKSGDFPADADIAMGNAMTTALNTWLAYNHPNLQDSQD